MKNCKQFLLLIVILIGALSSSVMAGQKTSAGTGAWNTAGTWSPSGVPASTDTVTINGGFTVTLDVTTTCAALTINAQTTGSGTTQLSIGAFTLTVTGNVAINGGGNGNRFSKIVMTSASGILDVGGNITIGNGGGASTAVLDLSNGTNLASTLKVKGSLSRNTTDGVFTPGTGSTVNFDGTAAGQTIDVTNFTYANVQ